MKNKKTEEVLHLFHSHSKDRTSAFIALRPAAQVTVLLSLSKAVQANLLNLLNESEVIDILEQMDPDKASHALRLFPEKKQAKILEQLSERLKRAVELLLEFDPNTAAGLMNLNYVQIEKNESIADAIKAFKRHEQQNGHPPIMVVMSNGRMKGYLPAYQLGCAPSKDPVLKHTRHLVSVASSAKKKEILDVFRAHPHEKMAVLGERGNLLGILYSDDVLRLLHEKEAESLYDFAGVHAEESVLDPAAYKVKLRYKWLIINLGTAFLAAFTVGLFEDTISKFVLLAVYMPIVAGMGGNAATQTLAVLVRGIALKQITLKTAWPTLRKEVIAGGVNGLINGLIVAVVILLVNRDPRMALVLALAMVINLLVAAFFGTLIPLIMQRLGKDPAASATVFITTATDVLGFMAFLGLATFILQ